MINITYSGWVFIFCLSQVGIIACLGWAYIEIRKAISNVKEQAMVDSRALATLINSKL